LISFYVLFLGMLHFDQPFGLATAPWDEAVPSADELAIMFRQFEAINLSSKSHVVVLNTDWRQTAIPNSVLSASGYRVNPVVWYKTDQNVAGDVRDLTFAFELMLLGIKRSPDASENRHMLDKDPTKRHNIIMGQALHKMQRYKDNALVNPHEKPEYIAGWLAKRYTLPRDWVIVIGAGAGGDARGYIKSGCHLVLIEQDANQYAHLCTQMATLEATEDAKDVRVNQLEQKTQKLAEEVGVEIVADKTPCPGCGTTRQNPPWLNCEMCNDACCGACTFNPPEPDEKFTLKVCSEACYDKAVEPKDVEAS
jgi:hypothetical protein